MLKKPTNAIIFDLGVVLINLDFERTVQMLLTQVPHLDRERFIGKVSQLPFYNDFETGKISSTELLNAFNQHHRTELTPDFFKEAWNAMILQFPPEKIQLLRELKNSGKKLFLLSNINELHAEAAEAKFKELELPYSFHSLFDRVYYSHEVKMRKPSAEIFELILTENHLKAEETLFVDDSLQHIKTAESLGFQCIHLTDPNALIAYF